MYTRVVPLRWYTLGYMPPGIHPWVYVILPPVSVARSRTEVPRRKDRAKTDSFITSSYCNDDSPLSVFPSLPVFPSFPVTTMHFLPCPRPCFQQKLSKVAESVISRFHGNVQKVTFLLFPGYSGKFRTAEVRPA